MDKKEKFKEMFLHLFLVLIIIGLLYAILNEMFEIPLPLLFFVHCIFTLLFTGCIFGFIVNIVALFGEEDSPETDKNMESEIKTTKNTTEKRNKSDDKWIKLK